MKIKRSQLKQIIKEEIKRVLKEVAATGARPLEEQKSVSHMYQVHCKLKLRKDADRELLKTDIRAIKGVTIVTTVPQSEETSEFFSHQVIILP